MNISNNLYYCTTNYRKSFQKHKTYAFKIYGIHNKQYVHYAVNTTFAKKIAHNIFHTRNEEKSVQCFVSVFCVLLCILFRELPTEH